MASVTKTTLVILFVCATVVFIAADAQPGPKTVRCKDKKGYPLCGDYLFRCPATCPTSCSVDCELCRPICTCDKPGGVCQDPRFIGGDGITFYFHGKKGRDFCLLSDADLHINAHFIGKRDPTMSRDFTWVQSIALLFDDHRVYVGAQKTSVWDDSSDRIIISYDGETIQLPTSEGASWKSTSLPYMTISRSAATNAIVLEVENKFKITTTVVPITAEESRVHNYGITEEDCFAHLELGFKFYSLTEDVHGVLGQTYRNGYVSNVEMSSDMPLMGGERKFSTSELFEPDCAVSRFGRATGIAMVSELSSVNCASGMSGRGIVCKK